MKLEHYYTVEYTLLKFLRPKIHDSYTNKDMNIHEVETLLNKLENDRVILKDLKKDYKNMHGILEDFMNMLNKLQANPTDEALQSASRDMLMMMDEEILK